jgi:hypothetical protein
MIEPLDFRLKTFCCGGPIFMPQEEVEETALKILKEAEKAAGAMWHVSSGGCHAGLARLPSSVLAVLGSSRLKLLLCFFFLCRPGAL